MDSATDIRNLIETIGDTLSRLDLDAWCSCFQFPVTFVLDTAAAVFQTREDTREAFNPMFEGLRQRGFTGTNLNTCNIHLLSESAAVVSAVWTRYAGDQVMEKLGATYFVVRQDGEWKAVLVSSHSPDVVAIA